MTQAVVHYSKGEEGTTYCGYPYKMKEFPDMRQTTLFSIMPEQITCKKCKKKLQEEANLQKKLTTYYKKIEKELESDDDYQIGYFEAVSNLLGNFNNGRCEDCGFVYETSCIDFESQQPEGMLNCSIDLCWIDEVKDIIRGGRKNDIKQERN